MKKIKLIFLGILPTTLIGLAPLTSCNKSNYVMSELTKEIIEEMTGDGQWRGLCSIPRPSFHCKGVSDFLVNKITGLFGEEGCDVKQDDYYNVWVTIPANGEGTNWQPIILQGHMDMVVAGLSEEESLKTPIHPVIDGRLLHSKDNKTSLGADNGVGVAIMLQIIEKRKEFDHGPIRCIFTTEEEVGMIGAQNLTDEALKIKDGETTKFIPYLLNIDGETEGDIYRSCLGCFRDRYTRDYEKPAEQILPNAIDLRIDGLKGGHSGADIVLGRASADRIIFEFMHYLIEEQHIPVQIAAYDHVKRNEEGQEIDVKWGENQLIANGRIVFYTDASADDVDEKLTSYLDTLPSRYPDEEIQNWKISVVPTEWGKDKPFINKEDSTNLAWLIGNNIIKDNFDDIENYGIPYGVFATDETTHNPIASANIGPIVISDQRGTKEDLFFNMVILYRTGKYGTVEEQDPAKWSIGWAEPRYARVALNKAEIVAERETSYQPWESTDDNSQMIKYLKNAYEQIGVRHKIVDAPGGMEIAQWITKNPSLICGCIGATINNAHSVNETLHLDTIDNLYNVVLKTINWMKNPT